MNNIQNQLKLMDDVQTEVEQLLSNVSNEVNFLACLSLRLIGSCARG